MSMQNFHFWVQDHKLWSGPPVLTSGGNLGNSFFFFLHILSNDMCKFAINLSASAESHLKMLIYYFFYWKCRFEMAVMHLILQETPIKDVNAKLSYLSSGSQVVEWTPQFWHLVEILEILFLLVLSNDTCNFAINLFPISWEPFENVNLLFFLLKMQIWNGCNALNIAGNPHKRCQCKTFVSEFRITSCGVDPPVLTSGGNLGNSTFAYTLQWYVQIYHKLFFTISWEPFENVNLLFFLLEMQIWNGCNALNIAGNPIKDINAQLSFLSSGSQVVEWTPSSDI